MMSFKGKIRPPDCESTPVRPNSGAGKEDVVQIFRIGSTERTLVRIT